MNTNALQGILWMLLTTLLFVMVTAVVRYIGDAIPASQAAFIRYVIGTIILLPFIIPLIRKSITRKDLIIYFTLKTGILKNIVHLHQIIAPKFTQT